jgi:hypothetical protein
VTRSRRAGVAIADFLAGTFVLAGALTAFASMTRAKIDALGTSDQRALALAAAEEAADRVRTGGLPAAPHGDADPDGFRAVATFRPETRLAHVEGRIEARSLRFAGAGDDHDLFEARITVRWKDGATTFGQLALSTIAAVSTEGR